MHRVVEYTTTSNAISQSLEPLQEMRPLVHKTRKPGLQSATAEPAQAAREALRVIKSRNRTSSRARSRSASSSANAAAEKSKSRFTTVCASVNGLVAILHTAAASSPSVEVTTITWLAFTSCQPRDSRNISFPYENSSWKIFRLAAPQAPAGGNNFSRA